MSQAENADIDGTAGVGESPAGPGPAGDAVAGVPVTDWTLRPFLSLGRSPLWFAAIVVGSVTLAAQLLRQFADPNAPAGPFERGSYLGFDILNAVVIAYMPTALVYLRRARIRDLRDLRPHLEIDDASYQALLRETLCVPAPALFRAGLVGALAFASIPIFDPGFWGGAPRPALHEPLMIGLMSRSAVTGWLAGHSIRTELRTMRSLERMGAEFTRVDLHDLSPLAPFARASQRGAFAWVLVSSLVSLFWLGSDAGNVNTLIIGLVLSLAGLSLFFSLFGVHRRIVAEKQALIRSLDARIAPRARALVEAETPPPSTGGDLADLIAYRDLIERVREWPIGAPALLRGSLIIALALGSWLGGALAERVVDDLLG